MTCFDLLGTGTNQLITGWESGKVIDENGDILIFIN